MLKQTFQKVANQLGYQIAKLPSEPVYEHKAIELPFIDLLDLVVQDYQRQHSDLFFVQIGAHDGCSADPVSQLIKRYHWRGILVEPQPQTFNTLIENYRAEPQLIFENAAIGTEESMATLYTVRQDIPGLPFWLSQSASLDRKQVLGALHYWRNTEQMTVIPADLESGLQEIQLPMMTIQSLLAKHQVEFVDLLVIDTMGFDFEILKMYPFALNKPAIIHFEHSLLSPADQVACLQFLAVQGYSLAKVAVDTIAYLSDKTRRWTVGRW